MYNIGKAKVYLVELTPEFISRFDFMSHPKVLFRHTSRVEILDWKPRRVEYKYMDEPNNAYYTSNMEKFMTAACCCLELEDDERYKQIHVDDWDIVERNALRKPNGHLLPTMDNGIIYKKAFIEPTTGLVRLRWITTKEEVNEWDGL